MNKTVFDTHTLKASSKPALYIPVSDFQIWSLPIRYGLIALSLNPSLQQLPVCGFPTVSDICTHSLIILYSVL